MHGWNPFGEEGTRGIEVGFDLEDAIRDGVAKSGDLPVDAGADAHDVKPFLEYLVPLVVGLFVVALDLDQGGDCAGSNRDGIEGITGFIQGSGRMFLLGFEGSMDLGAQEGDLGCRIFDGKVDEHLLFFCGEAVPVKGFGDIFGLFIGMEGWVGYFGGHDFLLL